MELLKWASENGCPWDDELSNVIRSATKYVHLEVAEWARANGCSEPELGEESSDGDSESDDYMYWSVFSPIQWH
eukprot:SAG22_NODE_6048_length_910_cov_0.917386_2_plen_74_part_00